MTRATAVLAWLALLVGVPQVLMGILGLYEGGVRMTFWATLGALPFMPMLLRAMQRRRATPSTTAPLAVIVLAVASMAVSIWTYVDVVRTFAAD